MPLAGLPCIRYASGKPHRPPRPHVGGTNGEGVLVDTLARVVAGIDWVNRYVGRVVAWLTLATVIICGAVVVLRYAAGVGHVWMQELYVWTHAMTFLLAAGFAYLQN